MGSPAPQGTQPSKRWWPKILAAGVLLLALTSAYVLLQKNQPSVKRVDFDIVCERFVVPVALALNLNTPPSQMKRGVFFGFDGSVLNATSVRVNGRPLRPMTGASFSLTRSSDPNDTAPYLDDTPKEGLGKMQLELGSGAVLASVASPGNDPYLELKSAAPGDLHFTLQSKAAQLECERYGIREIFGTNTFVPAFSLALAGEPPGVGLDLRSVPSRGRTLDARITFAGIGSNSPDGELTLYAGSDHPLSVGHTELRTFGALNPDLRVEGKSATGVIATRRVDLRMRAESGQLSALGIVGDPDRRNTPALRVRGSLLARSVEQDGHELLPTFVEDVLEQPYPERSRWLLLLGVGALLAFKLVDRALNIVLKVILPE